MNDALNHPKILSRDHLPAILEPYRTAGKRLVFTNGCFDILHPGHVDLLARARALGDLLILGLNSDASVRRQGKGEERPFNALAARAFVLAHLEAVDIITPFDEDTPLELIKIVRPQVLVKGGDWAPEAIVGADDVLASGGEVHSLPLLGGYSTTGLARRIRGGAALCCALALTLLIGLGSGQALASPAQDSFTAADTDANGRLSRPEFSAAFPTLKKEAFDLLDANHDGTLSRAEWEAFRAGHGASGNRTGTGTRPGNDASKQSGLHEILKNRRPPESAEPALSSSPATTAPAGNSPRDLPLLEAPKAASSASGASPIPLLEPPRP